VPNTTLSGATRPCPGPASAPNWLRGKTVIVTGAGGGLGAAVAQVLGADGAAIVLADIAFERAREHAGLLAERDIRTLALALDVGDEEQVRRVVEQTRERFGRIDALVNSAAIDLAAPIAELAASEWERIVRTNLTGPFLMAKHVAAAMGPKTASGGGGQIVNIASTVSKRAGPSAAACHAAQAGLLGLSHALHAELRGQGIKVSAVVAGGMRTPSRLERFPDIDPAQLQDPMNVAQTVRFVLNQPEESVIPELMVLPMRDRAWP
jgi:NAD(P)-dependent dehydrogenase (short-subunit alcohol dehydrogenase family)